MIKCGVPQGSILGPLRFLIYINDLCTVCKNTIPVLFADDTNLFSGGVDGVNHDLAVITKWLKVNKLSLNIKKTHYICFTTKNKIKPDISLNIDGQYIAEVTSSKFLGVIIDDKLNWRDHVSFACRKVARGLGVIIKTRKVLQKGSLISLYYSFIYHYLIYCNQILGPACKTQIEPLFILQKKALRIITGVHPRSPSEPLFRQLKFLNCENIFEYLVGRLCIESIMASQVHFSFYLSRIVIYIRMMLDRAVIIIYQCAELILEKVVCDTLVLGSGTKFSVQTSIQMWVISFSQGI